MNRFRVEVPGRVMYSKWPPGRAVTLLDCRFTGGAKDNEFAVSTYVDAESRDEAWPIALERCRDATNLFTLCAGEDLELNELRHTIRHKGASRSTGYTATCIDMIIVSNNPVTEEQLEAVAVGRRAIAAFDGKKRERLLRALHWQALGRWEDDRVDRFIMYWIAVEVLAAGRGKGVVGEICKKLIAVYPQYKPQLHDIVGRIYGVRCNIVHEGIRNPDEVRGKLEQLGDILHDLLRHELSLPPENRVLEHIVSHPS